MQTKFDTLPYSEEYGVYYRPSSWDLAICSEQELYSPLRIESESVVLDLGAHIGSFAHWAHKQGAEQVICYEPEPYNFDILVRNQKQWMDVFQRAVISDPEGDLGQRLFYRQRSINTGMGSLVFNPNTEVVVVQTINFDSILRKWKPDFMKIDIEGSELGLNWPVLMANQSVKRFCVEYHFAYELRTAHPIILTVAECHELILGLGFRCYNNPDFTHKDQTLAFYERVWYGSDSL